MTIPSRPNPLLGSIAALIVLVGVSSSRAGTEIEAAPGKDKIVVPAADRLPPAMITLGTKASSDLTEGFLDSVLPFWAPGDAVVFLNTRTNIDSNDELLGSYGLGARYLVPGHDIIVGGNAYYDTIHGKDGSDFDELGLGAEILTRWVDARFNYYLPESQHTLTEKRSRSESQSELGPVFRNRVSPDLILFQQQRFTRSSRTTKRTYEAALEGWNAEVGFLVPGLDKYMELRFFAGAYSYDNPFGGDFTGFKARAEARILPGLIAGVEYWDDTYMTGGHWTGEFAVSVPFSIFNLANGRNPFEGTGEMFRPRRREFRERMSDMVVRSHRVMTITGTDTTTTRNAVAPVVTEGGIVLKPKVKYFAGGTPPPPQVDGGEGN
jgi:Inverse autotransporter, beta-domain